jgi:hypothetical protein
VFSNNGLAKTNHYRKHVREGKLVEIIRRYEVWPYQAIDFILRQPGMEVDKKGRLTRNNGLYS